MKRKQKTISIFTNAVPPRFNASQVKALERIGWKVRPEQKLNHGKEQMTCPPSVDDNYAKLNAMMAVSLEKIWKRRCREVLRQMEKERPELKKKRLAWEKSHNRRLAAGAAGGPTQADGIQNSFQNRSV